MINVLEIIKVIQTISTDNRKMKFLISLADYFFRFGSLTEKQCTAYEKVIEELKKEGELDV